MSKPAADLRAGFGAVVLAAGLSSRMGGENKMLRMFRGKPLVRWAVEAALASQARIVVLVSGRDAAEVEAAAGESARLRLSRNPDPAQGLASSLALGLAGMEGMVAAAILLGDMPGIEAELVDQLWAAFAPGDYAVVPTHGGRDGNPVLLSRAAIADCAALVGDQGARRLLKGAGVRRVAVAAAAILADLDTPADFAEP